MALHPQVEALVEMLAAGGRKEVHESTPEEARLGYLAMQEMLGAGPELPAVEDRTIPGPGGAIPIRIYTPEGSGPFPLTLFLHGGGFVIGDLDSHDRQCREIAVEAGCMVLSVHYRLSPEHRFPAAPEDAVAAMRWAAAHYEDLGVDSARVAVCGDSAGGNLSAVVAQAARDDGVPLVAQVLVYPAVDARDPAPYPSREENAAGPILMEETMRYFMEHYLGGTDADPLDPRLSPLHGNLEGLAPALVITAQYDPLRDEGEAYAHALEKAGVAVTLHRYDDMPHAFFQLAAVVDAGRTVVDECAAFLRAHFN